MDAWIWLLVVLAIIVLATVLVVTLRRSRRQGSVLAATPATKGRRR